MGLPSVCKLNLIAIPGPSNVPEMSASPVNRLVFAIRTLFSWLGLFFGPRAFFGGMRAVRS